MQVYTNRFSANGLDAQVVALRAIHGWLRKTTNGKFSIQEICRDNVFQGAGPEYSWLRSECFQLDDRYTYAWRLKHSDSTVRGRQWVIDIGLVAQSNSFDFTCSVHTDDMSTLVQSPVTAARPKLIKFVLDNLRDSSSNISQDTPGVTIKEVGGSLDSYRAFLTEIESPGRTFPILLVSPNRAGKYNFDMNKLQEQLFGLAQVVKVFPDFDSYDMEEQLGRKWSAWDGAVNLIPTRKPNGFIGSRLLRTEDLAEDSVGQSVTSYILSLVTHLTNIPLSRGRITLEMVTNLKLKQRLSERRAHLAQVRSQSELEDELGLVWDEIEAQNERIRLLESEVDSAQIEVESLSSDKEELESQIRNLKFKARHGSYSQPSVRLAESQELLDLLEFTCRSDRPTPRECLEIIEAIFPDRCEILPTAFSSADEVDDFTQTRRLLDMLRRLMTSYIEAIIDGGDSKAMEVFTNAEYAANESETVMSNSSLKQKRVFSYNGADINMFRHLKIGKADDTRKTIRLHFAWLADEKKIVIGYCGEHLPIKSH